jgi:para-aminobenzoate synthetase/4-amino-4-deoxychorismate lyase
MKKYCLTEIINAVLNNEGSAFFYTPPFYKKAKSYLFYAPVKRINILANEKVKELIQSLDKELDSYYGYCLLNYELGYLFEDKLIKYSSQTDSTGEFLFFDKSNVLELKSRKIKHDLTFPVKKIKPVKKFKVNTLKKEYINNVKKIKHYISDGDTYQVNYTIKGEYELNTDIETLIKILIFMQSAKFIAIINNKGKIIISISPELFFTIKKGNITVAPMKGTTQRGINTDEDKINKSYLINSEKEKSENLMIVDLMRNDVGRFAKTGSVTVKDLFKIEKYETLFQMISLIQAKVKDVKLSDVLFNIFPCGSITGAPKIRTMEIIKEIEKDERGFYTGAIGFFKGEKVSFNVAIRTLVVDKETNKGVIGLGSGIVWDSIAEKEYDEIKLKSSFLTKPFKYFEIFESFLVEGKKKFLLKEHLSRLEKAADFFLFNYNEKEIKKRINTLIDSLDYGKYKVKVILNKWGNIKLECENIVEELNNIKVVISEKRVNSRNKFQYFKTTNRELYNKEFLKYKKNGYNEVIFLNENDVITEGTYTNIFIVKQEEIITPPVNAGILNGIYRKQLLKNNKEIKEQNITIDDIKQAHEVFVCNSVRKKIKVTEVWYKGEQIR